MDGEVKETVPPPVAEVTTVGSSHLKDSFPGRGALRTTSRERGDKIIQCTILYFYLQISSDLSNLQRT